MLHARLSRSCRLWIAALATVSVLAMPAGALVGTPLAAASTVPGPGDRDAGPTLTHMLAAQSLTATTTSLASTVTEPVVGQSVGFTVTVAPVPPGTGTPTGNVTVTGNAGALCVAALDQSEPDEATCTVDYPDVGSDSVTASYGGDSNYAGSGSNEVGETISADTTTTSITADPSSPEVGQSVTFTATVSVSAPGSSTPTGKVTFAGDGGTLCSANLDDETPDQAVCSASYPAVGSDSVTASYGGDSENDSSSSSSTSISISQAGTSTAISSNVTDPVVGQPVTFTATVAVTMPGAGTPTGNVKFVDGGGTICTEALDQADPDQATCTTSYPAVGSDSVTADYKGDSNFQSSASGSTPETISQSQTATAISASPTDPVVGEPVTYTANVAPVAPGSGTPTGTVDFADTTGNLCSTSLNQMSPDEATCTTTYTTSQDDSITATYEGDDNYEGSESPTYAESVSPASTSTGLSSSDPSPVVGESVTYTATVAVLPPGSGTPDGTVTFTGPDGGTLCTTALDQHSSDQAQCTVSYLSSGSQSVIASYNGNSNDNSSSSSEMPFTVAPDDTSTSITSTDESVVVGESVTFTATVTPVSPGSGTPTGKVTFTGDAGTLCTVELDEQSSDQATCSTSYSQSGSDSVVATYQSDSNYSSSESSPQSESIGVAATTTILSANSTSTKVGRQVTYTANVSVGSPGSGLPGGNVTFTGDSGQICVSGLDDGTPDQATCTTTYASAGTDTVKAVYEGSDAYGESTSNSVTESIDSVDTKTKLSSSAPSSETGENVTFTVKVSSKPKSAGTPTGNVEFVIETVANVMLSCKKGNSVPLSGGTAKCEIAGKDLFAYQSPLYVSAGFQGTTSFDASSSDLRQDVYAALTKVAVTASHNPASPGEAVKFTAVVSPVSPGEGTPTGALSFSFSSDSISCEGSDTFTLSDGEATCSIASGTLEASVTVRADYAGTTPPAYVASHRSLHEQVS